MATKAICCKINIFQTFRNIYLSRHNPKANPIYYIVCVITFGEATNGKWFIVENTIKVCVSVTANGHKLVFGDGNCETRDAETWFRVDFQRHTRLLVTVNGVIHQDIHHSFNGNVCNVEFSSHWLRLAIQVATVNKKVSTFFPITTFSCAKGIWNFYISPQLSEQLGKANGYAIAAAAIIVVNITPTQVTCTSIEWKPIAPLFP